MSVYDAAQDGNIQINDSDTFIWKLSDDTSSGYTYSIAGTPDQHGWITLTTGKVRLLDNATGEYEFEAFDGASGPDSFTYSVDDGQGNVATATMSLDVAESRDHISLQPEDMTDGSISGDGLTYTGVWGFSGIRATEGLEGGKWYFEIQANSYDTIAIGWTKSTIDLSSASDIGFDSNGDGFRLRIGYENNSYFDYLAHSTQPAKVSGDDTLGVAFDIDNGVVSYFNNGVLILNASINVGSGKWYPTIKDENHISEESATIVFSENNWVYSPPDGFYSVEETLSQTIVGTIGNDVLSAQANDDHLLGLEGDDLLKGGAGDDTIDGGAGEDTAVFEGNKQDASFDYDFDTEVLTVSTPLDGVDSMSNVETLQFADGDYNVIKAGQSTSVGGLENEHLVNPNVQTDNARDISVTALSTGGYVVTWSPNQTDVYFQRYDAQGQKVGVETLANLTTAHSQADPFVTALDNGEFVITWEGDSWHPQEQQFTYKVWAQAFYADGTKKGSEILVNPPDSDPATIDFFDEINPSVTALNGGGYMVAWLGRHDGYAYQVHGRVVSDAGVPTGDSFPIPTSTYYVHYNPELATLANGNVIAVWQDSGQDGDVDSIRAQILDPTGQIVGGGSFPVNTTTTGAQTEPQVTPLSGGGFAVTWLSSDADGSGVYVQQFDANGTKIGSEQQVNSLSDADQDSANIAALPDGGYIVTWRSEDPSHAYEWDMKGQAFSSTGEKVGAEFTINQSPGGDNGYFGNDLAVLNDGSFVEAWHSFGNGVRARRMDIVTSSSIATGTSGDDILLGTDNVDEMAGLEGDDLFFAGAGDDMIDGGAGEDTAVFEGLSTDYDVVYDNVTATWTVTHLQMGEEDTLINVENLQFDDLTQALNSYSIIDAMASTYTIPEMDGEGVRVHALNRFALTGQELGISAGSNMLNHGYSIKPYSSSANYYDMNIYGVDIALQYGDIVTNTNKLVGTALKDYFWLREANDVVEAGSGDDFLNGYGGDDSLWGQEGADRLYGGIGVNYLDGGSGNDVFNYNTTGGVDLMIGGTGDDVYHFNRGSEQDVIDNHGEGSSTDYVNFLNISYDQLWFRQDGTDLEVSVIGTNDTLNIQDWYLDSGANQVSSFEIAGSNGSLLASSVQSLVDVMAQFNPPAFGNEEITDESYYDPVLAQMTASWDNV